jgi:hypothetical protein
MADIVDAAAEQPLSKLFPLCRPGEFLLLVSQLIVYSLLRGI